MNTLSQTQRSKLGVTTFLNIANEWCLTQREQFSLLGNIDQATFSRWYEGNNMLTQDALDRISYLISIYQVLGLMFKNKEQANAWIKKANTHYGGNSALEYMMSGSIQHLEDVEDYLSANLF